MTELTTLSSKGQIVLPKHLREDMHLDPGTVFAIFTSLVNVGQAGIGMLFMGFMIDNYSYFLAYVFGALITIPIIALARFIKPPWKEKGTEPME